ncbi:hypothetical protein JOD45_001162 [Scopulibacillus daqui]|uniref:Uncharacterized protein n=1 Tax=Scopulibacillus daqui TaxID=1469162 RepID=A0ABS2PY28_9BACL|nr:hypothetical protein [Scopulibacillus daqui]MBM7644953.1 hypothetical protein [Scopulibacillus daqui]
MKKYNIFIKSILVVASFLLVFTVVFTPISKAKTANKDEMASIDYNKRVKQFEDAFKFIYGVAAITDKNGNVIDFDFDKIREKYGDSKPLDMLEKEINDNKQTTGAIQLRSYWGCMKSSLIDFFGVNAVQAAINGGIANYIRKHAFKEAAKLAAKYFVGTSVAGIITTLTYYGTKCTFTK